MEAFPDGKLHCAIRTKFMSYEVILGRPSNLGLKLVTEFMNAARNNLATLWRSSTFNVF